MFGSGLIVFAVAVYLLSFFAYKKENTKLALILVVFGGLLLRMATASDPYLHNWDERYHALVAKHLANHFLLPTLYDHPVLRNNYQSWTTSHIWVHKQPLPLWAMALGIKVFGTNEIAIRIPSVILSTLAIYLTYLICLTLFKSQRMALCAAFLHSINGLIIEITGGRVATDHVDLFFLFFVELGVFFSVRYMSKRSLVSCLFIGTSMGLAILCKWMPALIILPVWTVLGFDRTKFKEYMIHTLVIVLSCVCIFLPWQLYIHAHFPQESKWEAGFNLKHLTEVLDGQTGGPLYYLEKAMSTAHEFILLILAWLFYRLLLVKPDRRILALMVWIILPVLFFSMAKTKMQAYTLFIFPAVFIVVAFFLDALARYKSDNKVKTGLVWFVVFAGFVLPVRYAIERIKPFEPREKDKTAMTIEKKELNKKNLSANTILFNDSNSIETMFYTHFTSYPQKPNETERDTIQKQGCEYRVLPDNRAR